MKTVVMLLSNPFRPDLRVKREAEALADHNYRVVVICWDRQAELAENEAFPGIDIIRVQNVKSAYASGWRQLFFLPRFWRSAQRLATRLQPDVVHCHDLDTLFAGWQVKRRLGCPLVYDAHEHYPAVMSLYLPASLVNLLVRWERMLVRRVDVTVTASTVLRDEFLARGLQPVITLGNFQENAPYDAVTATELHALRTQLGVSPDDLLIAYIGGLTRDRMLLPFIEAAGSLPQVHFHLWGDGPQRAEVIQAANRHANVHFHGWLSPADLPRYFKAADMIYYCLRLDYPGAVYNAPNTLSHAMSAGRPVIANQVGDLGRIVRETQCGILIEEATPEAIIGAIEELADPNTRTRLGTNALQAANNTYNAAMMQRQLVEIYRKLLE